MATTVYHLTDVDDALAVMEDGFRDEKHQVANGETREGVRVIEELPSDLSKVPLEVNLKVEPSELVEEYGVGTNTLILPADYINSGAISLGQSIGYCNHEKHEYDPGVDLETFHFKCCWQCRDFSETDNEAVLNFAYAWEPITKEEVQEVMDWIDSFFVDVIESRGLPMSDNELDRCTTSALEEECAKQQSGCCPGGRRGENIEQSLMSCDLIPDELKGDSWPEELTGDDWRSPQYQFSSLMWRRIATKLREGEMELSEEELSRLDEIIEMQDH